MTFPSQVRTIDDLHGPAGRLEAILNTGAPNAAFTALLAHPHPPSGGTMHNKVIYHASKVFTRFAIPVLRFNFRGTGRSEGVHDEGHGEVDDVRAAVDYLTRLHGTPVLFCGFSFGSHVGFRACCGDSRVAALIGLGLPVRAAGRDYRYHFLPGCSAPKLFVSGSEDEFCPPEVLHAMLAPVPANQRTVIVPGADHFFQGTALSPQSKLDQMQSAVSGWLSETFGFQPQPY